MKLPSRRQIVRKLSLEKNELLYLLLSSKWFRRAFIFSLILIICTIVSVIKLWPSTPSFAAREVKISILDWLQATSLARSARHEVRIERFERAFSNWRAAIGNHPGSKQYNREYLDTLVQFDRGREYWKDALQTTLWLMHLSPGNIANLELGLKALEHYHLDGHARAIIDSNPELKSASVAAHGLRLRFRQGQLEDFNDEWKTAPTETRKEPLVQLYRASYEIVRGDSPAVKAANERLLNAVDTLEFGKIAARLLLYANFVEEDVGAYGQNLDALSDAFIAQPIDHVRYWRLLTKNGQNALALQSAARYNPRPRTHEEVMQLADGYARVGLPDIAIRLIESKRPEFGFQARDWQAQTDLLIAHEKWTELTRAAMAMRSSFGISEEFLAYSYFLQGLSEHHRHRSSSAINAFQQIQNFDIQDSEFGLSIGAELSKLGYTTEALEIIALLRNKYQNNLAYWALLFDLAMAERSITPLLRAAENLHRMQPKNHTHKVNLAAVLISMHIRKEEALRLTSEAMVAAPREAFVRINYSHALIRHGQLEKAKAILSEMSPSTLSRYYRQGYYLAAAELYFRLENWEMAKRTASFVDPQTLLPGDREMLQEFLLMASLDLQ